MSLLCGLHKAECIRPSKLKLSLRRSYFHLKFVFPQFTSSSIMIMIVMMMMIIIIIIIIKMKKTMIMIMICMLDLSFFTDTR